MVTDGMHSAGLTSGFGTTITHRAYTGPTGWVPPARERVPKCRSLSAPIDPARLCGLGII